jgi:hypothetical protein
MLSIPIRFLALRLVLLLAGAGALGWLGWTIARAALGDSFITFVERHPNLSNEARLQGAERALAFAPSDPLVRWQRGGTFLTIASEEDADQLLPQAVAELRTAVRLSPADARIWLTLGRALERSGATAEAHAAFVRATELAPRHFETQWGLGNHLLRAGQRDAAFEILRQAWQTRPSSMPLIFDYAWNAFDGDSAAVSQALGVNALARSQVAALLVGRGRRDEALTLWRENGPHLADETLAFIQALTVAGHYRSAAELWQTGQPYGWPRAEADSKLANGGFEQNFDPQSNLPLFSWRSAPGPGVSVSLDRLNHAVGKFSLRLRFDAKDNPTLLLATQTVPVQPKTNYCLRFSYKTDTLQSLSTPVISVQDAADERRLAVSTPPLPNGTSDWQALSLRFTTKAETEAVTVRAQRLPCAEPPCPLNGRLWLDDFKLTECTSSARP